VALLLSTGEPAGIGPDLVLALAAGDLPRPVVALGDVEVLAARARTLKLGVALHGIAAPSEAPAAHTPGELPVWHFPVAAPVRAGRLDPANAAAVIAMLAAAADACLADPAHALVTAPVHKGVINDAGIPFSGHTEFLAERAGVSRTVMLLVAGTLRVALATTHLPLRAVPDALTRDGLAETLRLLEGDLRRRFDIASPQISVCGLNPHAGEGGHLGREEIEVIAPVVAALREEGLHLNGPLPADTAFPPRALEGVDAVLSMFHDQGLPVLKALGFGEAVNVTLGLPFVRTSVDHGTALDLAGTGRAEHGSLRAALALAARMQGA
jgi:4-hydroxythreonine-4-phosphate dehydrogenase